MKKEFVDNYLKIIGISEKIVNIADINNLMKAHIKTFPFSSLKVLLKEDISLDIENIYKSLVLYKRGGYCFEHNKLLYEILKYLGFNVEHYLARVVNNTDAMVPQTHRFTLLNLNEEKYLLDVGIGFRTPSIAVKFGVGFITNHLDKKFRIVQLEDNQNALQILNEDEVFTVTKFDLNKCYESDFEMGHFYSYKNPNAVFVNNLVISLITENELRSLVNDKYFKIYKDSQENVEIDSLETFKKILLEDFNVEYEDKELELLYSRFIVKTNS